MGVALDRSYDNEVEIWYEGKSRFEVSLIDPSGAQLGPFALGTTTLLKSGGVHVGTVFHRQNDSNNHDNHVDILLDHRLSGSWSIVLQGVGTEAGNFHAWIERDDKGRSQFSPNDDDPSHTIGSIACGQRSVVVGSYDATVPGRTISSFSSEGPTRDGRHKPEVSAPGEGVFAASSQTQTVFRDSGTSMAAPHVSGLIALLMQATPQVLTPTRLKMQQSTSRGAFHRPAVIGTRVTAPGASTSLLPCSLCLVLHRPPWPRLPWRSHLSYSSVTATAIVHIHSLRKPSRS